MSFSQTGSLQLKNFCMFVTGTLPQSTGFRGVNWMPTSIHHWEPYSHKSKPVKQSAWFLPETPSQNQKRLTNFNKLQLRQNGHNFADNIFKCICFTENLCILIKISLKFIPKSLIDNNLACVQVMAWCQTCIRPLLEPVMTKTQNSIWHHYTSIS